MHAFRTCECSKGMPFPKKLVGLTTKTSKIKLLGGSTFWAKEGICLCNNFRTISFLFIPNLLPFLATQLWPEQDVVSLLYPSRSLPTTANQGTQLQDYASTIQDVTEKPLKSAPEQSRRWRPHHINVYPSFLELAEATATGDKKDLHVQERISTAEENKYKKAHCKQSSAE